jgi:hypothetical protein
MKYRDFTMGNSLPGWRNGYAAELQISISRFGPGPACPEILYG